MLQAPPASVGSVSEPTATTVIEGVVDEDNDGMPELEDASEGSVCSCSCHDMPKAAAAPPTPGRGRVLYETAKGGSGVFTARHEYYAVPGVAQFPVGERYSVVDYIVSGIQARVAGLKGSLVRSGGSRAGGEGRIDGEVCETAWASAVECELSAPILEYDMACTGFDGRPAALKAKM